MCRPTPTINFRRRSGSTSLPFGRHETLREGTELFITNVRPSDEGDYACLGSNSVGQTEEIIQIDVQGIRNGFNLALFADSLVLNTKLYFNMPPPP